MTDPFPHLFSPMRLGHPELRNRIRPKGVAIRTDTLAVAVDGGGLRAEDRYTREGRHITADSIVLAMGNEVDDGLYHAPKARHPAIHAIGDFLAPRWLDDAIRDGERIGRMI